MAITSRLLNQLLLWPWIAAVIATCAVAQDFEFTPMKPVPPHGQPWVETAEPDVRTAALWKFVSDADRSKAADKLLEEGGLDDLGDDVDTDADPLAAGPAGKGAGGKPPKLVGKAAIKDAAGRLAAASSWTGPATPRAPPISPAWSPARVASRSTSGFARRTAPASQPPRPPARRRF
ncbi:MAG: hypothetical protein ACKOHG_20420 [Planctomycetia bacterium]